jgi:DNA-binding MarR family transcriptional regulator
MTTAEPALETPLGTSLETPLETPLEPGEAPCERTEGSVEQSLGWALRTVLRCYARHAAAALADLPGGPRGHHVLAASADEQPITQAALGRRVGVDRSVMTYLVDDLVEAGLVERRPDPDDRRARRIAITAAGRTRLALLEARLGQVDEHLLATLQEPERAAFRSSLRRLAVGVHEHDADECAGGPDPGADQGAEVPERP